MVFLEVNGLGVGPAEDDAVQMILSVAAKELDVAGIAEFLEERAKHASPRSGTPSGTIGTRAGRTPLASALANS
jgi:hypothetical protein